MRDEIERIAPKLLPAVTRDIADKGNAIADLSPLEPLTDLQFVFLENNKNTDLTPLHRMWKKDNEGAREWAPYCQIDLTGNPLDENAKKLVEELKKAGARITP